MLVKYSFHGDWTSAERMTVLGAIAPHLDLIPDDNLWSFYHYHGISGYYARRSKWTHPRMFSESARQLADLVKESYL